jgi:uncharacterized protein (TIGR00255 family)
MIHSMTGFASNQVIVSRHGKQSVISAQLKSLNSRFFELTCKLPPSLQYLETALLKKIKGKMARGHFYLHIYMTNSHIFANTSEPFSNNLDAYITGLEKIRTQYGIQKPITLDNILRLPGIFNNEEISSDNKIEKTIFELVDQLIGILSKVRHEEGIGISQDLSLRIKTIQALIEGIEKASADYIQKTKEQLAANTEKAQDVTEALNPINEIQTHALYALLDKIDVHEELSRFKSHLDHITKQLILSSIEKGKILDFIVQELVREINTIASKCPDKAISSYAINVKVEIEKMREQIQNIV